MEGAIINGVITSPKEKMGIIDLENMINEISNNLPMDLELIEVFPQTKKQAMDSIRKIKVCSEDGAREMKVKLQKIACNNSQLSFIG